MRGDDPVARADQLQERGDVRAAFRSLLRAAQRGDRRAYLNLGYAYDVGLGIRKSKRRAVRWYRRAVAAGEAAAAHNIATVYRDRDDVAGTLRWLQRAVELGDSGSNVLMGQLLLSRMGRPDMALACFRAVSNQACEADVEAARLWAATAESMIASDESRGGRTRA